MPTQLKPAKPIRRFDVFAEYRRLAAEDDGMPTNQAKGYGLWVAKVVAARKSGRVSKDGRDDRQASPHAKWHELSGEPQTDERFDHEIVDRMGAEFYRRVFAPAVREARAKGDTCRCGTGCAGAGNRPGRPVTTPEADCLHAAEQSEPRSSKLRRRVRWRAGADAGAVGTGPTARA
jgi:hypothetical protein